MKKNLLILVFIITCFLGFGQTTIYLEDFTGQAGKGAVGPGGNNPTIDLSNVDWSIDVSNVNLANTNDFFFVRTVGGNDLLEGRDLDGNAIWLSPSIDILGFTNVSFTIDVSESNGTATDNLEANDTVTIEYRVDSDPWTTAATNGTYSNDYDLTVTSQTGLSGSTLELRIIMLNNGGGERQRIDNVEVTGICPTFNLPFNEDFEGGIFPPSCWSSFRGTNGLGINNDWTSSTLIANSGTTSAFVEYEVVTGGNAQDWLVTPAVDLGTAQAQLRFFARDQFTIDYNTEYTVRVSQTSATDISSFTILQTYDETQLGNPFNEKTIDLSAYTGVVYIAFVMEQNDGDNWFLDDVSITDISSCTTPTDVTNLTANYIDGNIDLQWALSSCYDEVMIVGKEGNVVTAIPSGDGSAYLPSNVFGSGTEITTDEFVILQGTDSSVTVTNVLQGNTYHFEVFTRKGTTWSVGVPINITLDYCSVTGDITFDTSITLVDFGSINNVTGQGSGYDDFTSQSTSIARGASEDLTVNLNTDTSGFYAVYSYAWIDWNKDGDFNDANETYDLGDAFNTANGPTSNSPLTITVPNDAELGDTRLRVLCQYYFGTIPTNGPCDGSTDGEIEDYTITILPGTVYTYDNGWLPSDPNGVATTADDIVIANGDTVINTNTDCNTLTVNPGAGLTINSGVTLTAINELVLESTSVSYASLILDGIITGNVIYRRHVNIAAGTGTTTGNNDLISAPLTGQNFGDFRVANPNIRSGLIGGNPAFLFGPFNTSSGNFINYQPTDDTEILDAAEGFRTGSTDNDTYTFTGTVETGSVNIAVNSGGTSDWNLIGNPYPSYLNVQTFLNNTNNASILDENAVGIYGYDGAANDGWTIYNLATTTPSTIITPGQGFFIQAESSGNINFTPSMRSTGNSDDFIIGRNPAPLVYLKLQINTDSKAYHTDFYFNENASTDLDPGYDASVWNSIPGNFSLHSYLVENDNNNALALQTLHSNDLFNVTIPLGVNANANEILEFSILESTIPNGINVYLEDTVTETITLLNNENYSLQPDTVLNGKGRFYLRFVSNALSTNENALNDLEIFTNQEHRSIIIKGNLIEATHYKLYDLQGRLVKSETLKTNQLSQAIDVSQLSSGVFIISILNDTGIISQKVILK